MPSKPIVILPITIECSKLLKSIKECHFKSFTDSDLLLHILNKRKEKLKNKSQFQSYTTNLSLEFPELKKETETNKFSNDVMKKSIINIECKDCNKKFNCESDLLMHYNLYHKLPSQYKFSCGINYGDNQSYLQHNLVCHNQNSQQVSESKVSNKRFSLNINDENTKRIKLSESKLRTSAMISSECNMSPISNTRSLVHIQSNNTSSNIQDINNSVDIKSEESSKKFTCHCQMKFEDYYQFIEHSNQCGKQDILETSLNQTIKSSPLKMVANDEGKFDCKDCDKSFTSILSLRQHWDGMHRKDDKYICKKCGKGYRWCTSFHYHKKKCEKK